MAGLPSFLEHPSDRGLRDHQQFIDEILHERSWTETAGDISIFDKLPAEIIHQILSHLSAQDLACVSSACRILAEHGSNDRLWARLVNSHLHSHIHDPGPFKSFRRLYLAHLPYWFIPQNKIWFSDVEAHGCLILARYDNRRGVIEAYRVMADRRTPKFHIWEAHPDVMIQSFDPKISLWLDDPVLLLKDADMSSPIAACQTWNADRRMPMAADSQQVFSSLMLCPKEYPDQRTMSSIRLWPPAMIPSSERIARITTSRDTFLPSRASEASTIGLRIKRWANFRFQMTPIDNEAISNYATLDPALYVPTKEKPYQGIWVGDYSAHGCEFLLIYQMTQPSGFSPVDGREGTDQWNTLKAVKLTGDPNVPRGEVTFVAHDIGPNGLIRVADEEPFVGARIVHCFGHVAGIGFRDDAYIASQLILVSTDYIAHYWEEMGHISYFRRVDIDGLLNI
ncbi:F-box domain protein [Penicillium brasilianum]|uniref:F-box domain protein n=1 Tax=Penicillium brasilianum TaxID=104259 RepID=A0A1S9RN26_PENBI|nr:F-box domain protein [Penicillium brasilianum]